MARDPQGCKNWLRKQILAAGGTAKAVETVKGNIANDPFALQLLPEVASDMGIGGTPASAPPAPPKVTAVPPPPKANPVAPPAAITSSSKPAPSAAVPGPRPMSHTITAPQTVRGSGSAAPQPDEVHLR